MTLSYIILEPQVRPVGLPWAPALVIVMIVPNVLSLCYLLTSILACPTTEFYHFALVTRSSPLISVGSESNLENVFFPTAKGFICTLLPVILELSTTLMEGGGLLWWRFHALTNVMAFFIISVGALVLLSNKELVMYLFWNFYAFECIWRSVSRFYVTNTYVCRISLQRNYFFL